jgi:hypothetical protein
MIKTLELQKDPDRKWQPRVEMTYIGICDADILSKMLKKSKIQWCHDDLLMGYYFYLPHLVKGFECLDPGDTYYVFTKISKEYDNKKGRYKMIADINKIAIRRELREGKEF